MKESRQEQQPLISFAIPCYNSSDYMDACVQSILDGAKDLSDIEILIVNDGSAKDDTAQKADVWHEKYPQIISAVHQENGGHGSAVLTGLSHARGLYFKVVDSDDWLSPTALSEVLTYIATCAQQESTPDLIVSNYVYEHEPTSTQRVIDYRYALPVRTIFTWDEMGRLRPNENLLMHALMYKTEILKSAPLPMPRHTFYVDNIYAYVPLPRVKTVYYLDVDLYRYYIGREDQSVNEKVMISRIDQQLRVTRIMTDEFHLFEDISSDRLRSYMLSYLSIMYAICSIFSHLSDAPDAEENLQELWAHLKHHDEKMFRKIRMSYIGVGTNLPGRLGMKMSLGFYRVAQRLIKFN